MGSKELSVADLGDSTELHGLILRIQQGEAAARRLLLEKAHDRLTRLVSKILSGSFPSLQAKHDVQSVVHETWLRLSQALESSRPPTVVDFFRLAAHKIRQVLLDLVEREHKLANFQALGLGGDASAGAFPDPGQITHDPRRLAMWTEFHRDVEQLPDDQRSVFEMHYYLELPQVEIARLLNLSPRKVSYLWVAATESLAEAFGEDLPAM